MLDTRESTPDGTNLNDTIMKSIIDSEAPLLGAEQETKTNTILDRPINQFSFLMFGLGMLLPWNAMLAAMDFFEEEFPDYKPQFSLIVAVSVPLFFVQVLVYFFLQYIPIQVKLTVTFAINTVITVLLVLLPLQIEDQTTGYYAVLLLSVLFGCSYAVLQASLYGVAGPNAGLTNNLMIGIGLSGFLVNGVRMIFLAAVTNLNIEAQMFFYGSALFLAVCTVLSYQFVRQYEADPVCKQYKQMQSLSERFASTKEVYKINWKEAWSVALTFTVQFSFYPGVMLQPQFQFTFTPNFSWFVILIVTYASLADTLGRTLAGFKDLISKPALLWVCIVRGAFFTLLYMLTFENIAESFFGNQWFIIILLGLFAATCGYLTTVGMKYGSDEATNDRTIAGTLMGIHLSFGICLGSTFAIAFLS